MERKTAYCARSWAGTQITLESLPSLPNAGEHPPPPLAFSQPFAVSQARTLRESPHVSDDSETSSRVSHAQVANAPRPALNTSDVQRSWSHEDVTAQGVEQAERGSTPPCIKVAPDPCNETPRTPAAASETLSDVVVTAEVVQDSAYKNGTPNPGRKRNRDTDACDRGFSLRTPPQMQGMVLKPPQIFRMAKRGMTQTEMDGLSTPAGTADEKRVVCTRRTGECKCPKCHPSPPSKVKAVVPPHAPETCGDIQPKGPPRYSGLLGGGGKQHHTAKSGQADNCKSHEHVCGHSRSVCLSSDVSVEKCSPLFRARHKETFAGSVCSNREYFSDVSRSPSPFPSSPLPFSPLSPSFFPMSSCISSGQESMVKGSLVTAQSSGERFGRGRSTTRSSGPCSNFGPICCNGYAAEMLSLPEKEKSCTRTPRGDNRYSHMSI